MYLNLFKKINDEKAPKLQLENMRVNIESQNAELSKLSEKERELVRTSLFSLKTVFVYIVFSSFSLNTPKFSPPLSLSLFSMNTKSFFIFRKPIAVKQEQKSFYKIRKENRRNTIYAHKTF